MNIATARPRPLLPTPSNDAIVIEAYRKYREENDRKALTLASARLGCPKWHVNRRGIALGLARVKEKPWSAAEVELMEKLVWLSDHVIAKKLTAAGFPRTATAVHLKKKRLRLRAGIDGYSQTQLTEAFGFDHHVIRGWIKAGWLRGTRRQTLRTEKQGGDIWYFTHAAVYEFALRHPDEIDLCKVEKWWFLDLITNGKIGGR